jgi:LacI family transcriptional regulator
MTHSNNYRVVTQEDVARHAGVSRSIVSYVINNGPRKVSDSTRQRVLAAIKELEYRPNKHAQILSSMADLVAEKYIGIVLAGDYMFKRPYYGHILASIHEHAHQRDLHIRFIRVFDDFSDSALFNDLIHPDEINGAILLGLDQVVKTAEDRRLVDQIVDRVEHVVCVEWEWQGIPWVEFDRQDAAYQATKHLLDTGRKNIVYIGPGDNRTEGYHQAMCEQGLDSQSEAFYPFVNSEDGYIICNQLLQSEIIPDGICAGTDEVAFGVLKCLNQHGYRVPYDVAVTGIDNLDLSAFTIPSLTTVNVPKDEIGSAAINILVEQQAGQDPSQLSTMIKTQLVIRQSSSID